MPLGIAIIFLGPIQAQNVHVNEVYSFEERYIDDDSFIGDAILAAQFELLLDRYMERYGLEEIPMDPGPPDWLLSQVSDITTDGPFVTGTINDGAWRIRYLDDEIWPATGGAAISPRLVFPTENIVLFIGHDVPAYADAVDDDLSIREYLSLQYNRNILDGLPVYRWDLLDGLPTPIGFGTRLCIGASGEVFSVVGHRNLYPAGGEQVYLISPPDYVDSTDLDDELNEYNCIRRSEFRHQEQNPETGRPYSSDQYPRFGWIIATRRTEAGRHVEFRDYETDAVILEGASATWMRQRNPPGLVVSRWSDAAVAWDPFRADRLQQRSGAELESALREECVNLARLDGLVDPHETVGCAPAIPGAFWFYPLSDGLLVASNHFDFYHPRINRFAGLYIVRDGAEPRRILSGVIDGYPAVSPSGCRLAFAIAPFQEALTQRYTNTPVIAVVDMCGAV